VPPPCLAWALQEPKSRPGILEGRPSTGDAAFRRDRISIALPFAQACCRAPCSCAPAPQQREGGPLALPFQSPLRQWAQQQQHQPRPWSPMLRESKAVHAGQHNPAGEGRAP